MDEEIATTKMLKKYYELQDEYKKKYGNKTVVLMQVGAFYEVYGILHVVSQEVHNSPILEISKLCNLAISHKNKDSETTQIRKTAVKSLTLGKNLHRRCDD